MITLDCSIHQYASAYLVSIKPLITSSAIDNDTNSPNTNPGKNVSSPMPRKIQTIAVRANTPINTTSLELNGWRTVNPQTSSRYCLLHNSFTKLPKLCGFRLFCGSVVCRNFMQAKLTFNSFAVSLLLLLTVIHKKLNEGVRSGIYE